MNDLLSVFNKYQNALVEGDFDTLFSTLSDTIIWHQPGNSLVSGVSQGKESISQHLSKFSEYSDGTFKIITNWVSTNDCFVAANVTFLAEKGSKNLDMNGIDLFKIEDSKIQEVWLFSADQTIEDDFWR